MLHRSGTQEENLKVEPAPLWASSYTQYLYTKLKIHTAHADSPVKLFLNRILSWARNLDVGPVYALQIKKLRKRIFRVKSAPLWTSSYTQYLLCKAQDPFSTCRQSSCSKTGSKSAVLAIWMEDESILDHRCQKPWDFWWRIWLPWKASSNITTKLLLWSILLDQSVPYRPKTPGANRTCETRCPFRCAICNCCLTCMCQRHTELL